MQPQSCPMPFLPLPDHGSGAVAESFRMIKRPLLRTLHSSTVPNSNLIAVTSAMPAEGKSFCAVHLALSMAVERDTTVLLVDAHMAYPALPAMLGVPDGPGIMDLLLDDALSVADVIVKTSLPSLCVLPAGRCDRHAAELFASRGMGRLLDELASRYADRLIIFDTPALLVSTEASVLAAQMGQVVLVVEADATPRSCLSDALRYLEPCRHVHLVYNKADMPPPAYARKSASK